MLPHFTPRAPISQSQVCRQAQAATRRDSRGPSPFGPCRIPLCPQRAGYVEAQDMGDFHPSLKRYELAWCQSVLEL